MPARITVVGGQNQFDATMKFVLKKRADAAFRSSYSRIKNNTSLMISRAINASPTFLSLIGGKLQQDFGLTPDYAIVSAERIVSHIVNNIEVDLNTRSTNKNLIGSITLDLLPFGLESMSNLVGGSYVSTGGYGGGEVRWLEWLLTKGTQVVVGDFVVVYGESERSRAGEALMMRERGSGFRVDPEHAGTIEDNFITRAIASISLDITQMIKNELFRNL